MNLEDLKERLEEALNDADHAKEYAREAASEASSVDSTISEAEDSIRSTRSYADDAYTSASNAEMRLDALRSELSDLIDEVSDLEANETSEIQEAAEEVLHYAGLWMHCPEVTDTVERLRELRNRLRNNLGDADAFVPALCPGCGFRPMLSREQIKEGEFYICPACAGPLSISQPVEA
jgi:DNA repair exonuclease SbcCD ATPase subunit